MCSLAFTYTHSIIIAINTSSRLIIAAVNTRKQIVVIIVVDITFMCAIDYNAVAKILLAGFICVSFPTTINSIKRNVFCTLCTAAINLVKRLSL